MRKLYLMLSLCGCLGYSYAQAPEGLQQYKGPGVPVFYSTHDGLRTSGLAQRLSDAHGYFQQLFNIDPEYTVWVLSPQDWEKYGLPQAIYGIPHYLSEGKIVVASQDNDNWKHSIPPMDKLEPGLARAFEKTYRTSAKGLSVARFFDLLAIHELGHAFQAASGMKSQRRWVNELLCNLMLHAYIAQNEPKSLPALTLFPQASLSALAQQQFTYTQLEAFETNYDTLLRNHPDNYGWYQCRFHVAAAQIYDLGGVTALNGMWQALQQQESVLNDAQLMELLTKSHPAVSTVLSAW